MRRYLVHRGTRLIGGVEVTDKTAERLRAAGYRLLPA